MGLLKKIFYGEKEELPNEVANQKVSAYQARGSSQLQSMIDAHQNPQKYFGDILASLEGYKRVHPLPTVQRAGIQCEMDFIFQGGVTSAKWNSAAIVPVDQANVQTMYDGNGTYKPDQCLVRIGIPYDQYQTLISNKKVAEYFFQRALDYAKAETDKVLKLDSTKTLYGTEYLTFRIPTMPNFYIIEAPNAAGYEFRFFSQCRN